MTRNQIIEAILSLPKEVLLAEPDLFNFWQANFPDAIPLFDLYKGGMIEEAKEYLYEGEWTDEDLKNYLYEFQHWQGMMDLYMVKQEPI